MVDFCFDLCFFIVLIWFCLDCVVDVVDEYVDVVECIECGLYGVLCVGVGF